MTDRLASFAARLCLTAEVIARRSASIQRQKQVVQSVWPKALCHPIGSFQTRTSLENSDVDLLVSIPEQGEERKSVIAAAASMKEAVIKHRITEPQNCTVIMGARVPILTYMDKNEMPPLKFDISFQKENAVKNTGYLIEKFDERPFMRDLVIIMKYWLRERRFNEVYRGGLGSYAVSLTVIGFFNLKRRTLGETEYQAFIAGSRYDMFVEYLDFWTGWKYNENTMVPDPGIILRKTQNKKKRLPFMLRIIDPTDSDNDVGRASYKISRVIKEMIKLKRRIQHLGPGVEEWEFDQLLSGTPAEKEGLLKEKAHQDRNNWAMHLKMKKRIRKLEKKTNPGKSMKKTLARMKEKCEEFLMRRPGFAAEVARADYRLKATGGPEQDTPGFGRGLSHDTPMINPGEENMQPRTLEESTTTKSQNDEKPVSMEDEGKSPEQLEREAKHAATIEKKRVKREKMLQKRAERKQKEKERKAQKRMEEEMKRLKREEEGPVSPLPKAGKKAIEKEARNRRESETIQIPQVEFEGRAV